MTDAMLNFGDLKFIKLLVVSDKLERDRASKKFEQWARTLDRLTLSDARKLWKGLFYGMWSADKFPIQQQLSKRLASIILQFKNDELVLIYLEAFWDIITLEWSGIDRLRLNKFYVLLKDMLSSTNEWILREQLKNKPDIRSDGNPDLTVCYQSILQKYPFNLEMKIRPDGVRFYIVEQFFDIIKFYSMKSVTEWMLFFMSFYAEKRCSATLAKKIQTSLMKPFRDGLLMKTVDKKNDAEFLEKLQESSFLIGADPLTMDSRRKALYQFSNDLKQFLN